MGTTRQEQPQWAALQQETTARSPGTAAAPPLMGEGTPGG